MLVSSRIARWSCFLFSTFGGMLATPQMKAASLASDNAGNYSSWTSGSNAGTGFGSWTFSNNGNGGATGQFLGNSTSNGTSGSLGINSSNSTAFGMYAQPFNNANALRPFTGSLSIGQTFSMQFDNGNVGTGASVGFQLLNTSDLNANPTAPRFGFSFTGGQNNYAVTGNANQSTASGFTANGMTTSFTLVTANTYSFTVAFNNGATETFTGTLGGTAGATIDGFRIYDLGGGNGGNADNFYTNNFAVVPEPATYLGGFCLLMTSGCLLYRRRNAQNRILPSIK